jgi:C-terminal processing protease CtpA/Prc
MGFLAHTQALIIDVRQCLGGYPGMVALLCSYLFGEVPIHLASIYWRDEDITQEYWTEANLPVPRYPEKAVYVLTSKATFSAGEMIADVLQSQKRATIIGEKTDGGAHAGASYRIHPHFEAFIPIGRSINPLTSTNWEGSGVTPDISVPGEAGFNTAYKLALKSVLLSLGEPVTDPLRKLADETRAALKRLN